MTREEVYDLIDGEREYQKRKWRDVPQTVPAWLLIMLQELDKAMHA